MKKSLLATGVALAMGAGVAQAGFLDANSTYTVSVNSAGSCFAFGDCTTLVDNVLGGSFTITTDATGSSYSVGGYNIGNYTGTPGGTFSTFGPVTGTGTVSDTGQLDLNFDGRTGFATGFAYLGTPAWNVDDSARVALATGEYEGFTSGSDFNYAPDTTNVSLTLTGSHLSLTSGSPSGIGTWEGVIVSVGNVGAAWGPFTGTPYSEVYTISVTGHVPQVPVPAAVWLMGSGLVGLVGVARRRKRIV